MLIPRLCSSVYFVLTLEIDGDLVGAQVVTLVPRDLKPRAPILAMILHYGVQKSIINIKLESTHLVRLLSYRLR